MQERLKQWRENGEDKGGQICLGTSQLGQPWPSNPRLETFEEMVLLEKINQKGQSLEHMLEAMLKL
jgi:hypothetical protein